MFPNLAHHQHFPRHTNLSLVIMTINQVWQPLTTFRSRERGSCTDLIPYVNGFKPLWQSQPCKNKISQQVTESLCIQWVGRRSFWGLHVLCLHGIPWDVQGPSGLWALVCVCLHCYAAAPSFSAALLPTVPSLSALRRLYAALSPLRRHSPWLPKAT